MCEAFTDTNQASTLDQLRCLSLPVAPSPPLLFVQRSPSVNSVHVGI